MLSARLLPFQDKAKPLEELKQESDKTRFFTTLINFMTIRAFEQRLLYE
jgi:hypothetical protein